MAIKRIIKHFMTGSASVRAAFPAHALHAIEQAIHEAETKHAGQIRFAMFRPILRRITTGYTDVLGKLPRRLCLAAHVLNSLFYNEMRGSN